MSETLRRSLLPNTTVMLKWPNDALIGGAKVAGILLERLGDTVVVGIGVNVCHAPDVPGRETTSILSENSKYGGSAELVLSILAEQFSAWLSKWRDEPLAHTLDTWIAAAHPIGAQLSAATGDGDISGAFAGLDAEGALMLRLANGALRTIHAGDVSLITSEGS